MTDQNVELIDRYKLIAGATLDQSLNGSATALLCVIVELWGARRRGISFVSDEALERITGFNPRQLRRARRLLEERAYIVTTTPKSRGQATIYRIDFRNPSAMAAFDRVRTCFRKLKAELGNVGKKAGHSGPVHRTLMSAHSHSRNPLNNTGDGDIPAPARGGSDNQLGKNPKRIGPLKVIPEGEVSDELKKRFKRTA